MLNLVLNSLCILGPLNLSSWDHMPLLQGFTSRPTLYGVYLATIFLYLQTRNQTNLGGFYSSETIDSTQTGQSCTCFFALSVLSNGIQNKESRSYFPLPMSADGLPLPAILCGLLYVKPHPSSIYL